MLQIERDLFVKKKIAMFKIRQGSLTLYCIIIVNATEWMFPCATGDFNLIRKRDMEQNSKQEAKWLGSDFKIWCSRSGCRCFASPQKRDVEQEVMMDTIQNAMSGVGLKDFETRFLE